MQSQEVHKVYFVKSGESPKAPVKIGVTVDIDTRLAQMQTGNPQPLLCMALIHCDSKEHAYDLEKYLHRRLRKFRIQGEWFWLFGKSIKDVLAEYDGRNKTESVIQAHKSSGYSERREIERLRHENKKLKQKVRELKRDMSDYLDDMQCDKMSI